MNLSTLLAKRAEEGNRIKVGLIGAGKFGTMFLAQAARLDGIHLVGVCDLNPEMARSNLAFVNWTPERYQAQSLDDAANNGTTFVGDDWESLVKHPAVDIIIECTGNPISAVTHILKAFSEGKHVINVTVEADAFVGYGFAIKAREAGVIYSMAYGDQPALVADLVDWARACGFKVVAAGRGHKWLPHFRHSTPETVWDHWGLSKEQAERGRLNPIMFNSFLDGSKPAIECSAIANSCRLDAPSGGLLFPPGSVDDVPTIARPRSEGGVLEHSGMVETISSLKTDGTPIEHDIRNGVWVCVEADTEYLKNCFDEYKVVTDPTGRFMASYKRWHLIGLELPISVAAVGLRGEPTGVAVEFRADVASMAKRNLKTGETLDGEGGYTVSGALRPASDSIESKYVPLGLTKSVTMLKDVPEGELLTWDDVKIDQSTDAYKLRKEIESSAYQKSK